MKNEKVLITGCGGMLGNAIHPFFTSWYDDVLSTDKNVNEDWLSCLDVRDEDALGATFKQYKPNIVLHLAAETDLEFCETHPDTTKDTNDIASKNIAKLSEEHGATLIYISTAGVFDGTKTGPYTEDDKANPLMVYGKTKYAGEIHTLEHCSKSFVFRAGWMMGGGRRKEKKFIYKILQQIGAGKKEIFAVDDKWGTPTYTYDFAMNLFLLLKTKKFGRYHMVCEGKGTRYDVAKEILRVCNRPDIRLTAVDSSFFKEEYFAPRPFSEMMINKNLNALQINQMRPWKESLRDYIHNHFPDYINTATKQKTTHAIDQEAPCSEEERRKWSRIDFPSIIGYTIKNGSTASSPISSTKGITVNKNKSGLCLFIFTPVSEGQTIHLQEQSSTTLQEKTATVRWVRQEKSGVYKAGLIFD